jgi:hypothetical protein
VWQNSVNELIGENMEGIICTYNTYLTNVNAGFNFESADKLLKDVGVILDPEAIKQ